MKLDINHNYLLTIIFSVSTVSQDNLWEGFGVQRVTLWLRLYMQNDFISVYFSTIKLNTVFLVFNDQLSDIFYVACRKLSAWMSLFYQNDVL